MSTPKSALVPGSQWARAQNNNTCNFWQQHGRCRFGNNCKFSHEATDNGIVTSHRSWTLDLGENAKNTGGFALQDTNHRENQHGGGWGYDSDTTPTASSVNFANTDGDWGWGQPPTGRVRPAICHFWQAGRCNRGDNCRFRHDNEASQTASQSSETPRAAKSSRKRRSGRQRKAAAARQEEEQRKQELQQLEIERYAKEREEEEARQELQAQRELEEREEETRSIAREVQRRLLRAQLQREAQRERHQLARQEEALAELERLREAERLQRERLARDTLRRQEKADVERQTGWGREAQAQHKIQLKAKWQAEAAVVEQHVVLDSSLVTFGAGFDIRHIIPGFELCRITIKNLPGNAKRNEITDIFVQQGIQQAEFFLSQVKEVGSNMEAVVLANVEQGQAIALGLEGIEFREETLSFEISENASWNAMGNATQGNPYLMVNWKIPVEAIVATYSSAEEAQTHVRKLDANNWKGRQIRATLEEQVGWWSNMATAVRITNCLANARFDPNFVHFVGTSNLRTSVGSTTYDHQNTLALVRQHLASQSGILMNTYEIFASNELTSEQKVKVQFCDWEDVKKAHGSIHGKKLGVGITAPVLSSSHPKPLQYSIKISRRQYLAQRKQWNRFSGKQPESDARVHIRGGLEDCFIRVLGDDKRAVGSLKVKVENMVAGETLDATYWHPSFTASGETKGLFDRIYAATRAHIRSDFKSRSIKVYGEAEVLEDVRRMIKEEVDRLTNMETTRTLDRSLVGFFVREGLGRLKELLGEENINLDLASRPCKITIKGGEEAAHHLQRVMDEAQANSSRGAGVLNVVTGRICPICHDNVSHPEHLGCGHTYCSGCLKHFLISATDATTFPLVCMGNDATCKVPISIPFLRRFLPGQAFQQLLEVAFNRYLDQHPQEMKYCATPDCKQIYRRQTGQAMQCPSCLLTICSECDEAHEGMTCAEQRLHRNPAEQERLNEVLAAENGYRKCPECKVWIEKTEGCNHMACKCGAHICWRCMGVFGAREIYQHMTTVHGNIYDQVPAGVANGRVPNHAFLEEQINALAQVEREQEAYRRRGEAFQAVPVGLNVRAQANAAAAPQEEQTGGGCVVM